MLHVHYRISILKLSKWVCCLLTGAMLATGILANANTSVQSDSSESVNQRKYPKSQRYYVNHHQDDFSVGTRAIFTTKLAQSLGTEVIGLGTETDFITLSFDWIVPMFDPQNRKPTKLSDSKKIYLLPESSLKGDVTFMLKRVSSKDVEFYYKAGNYERRGTFNLTGSGRVSVLLSDDIRLQTYKLTIDQKEIPDVKEAHIAPRAVIRSAYNAGKPNEEYYKALRLDSLTDKVSREEINAFAKAMLLDVTPMTGSQQFNSHYYAYALEWAYSKKKDIALVNKLIDSARSIYKTRNDQMPPEHRFITSKATLGTEMFQKDPVAKNWPNYLVSRVNDNDEIEVSGDVDTYAPTAYLTVAARLLAGNPQLWLDSYQGMTYREILDEMIEYSQSTVDYFYSVYLDESTNLLKYPKGAYREGINVIINRHLPFTAATIALAEAYESLGIRQDMVLKIDSVNQAFMDLLYTHYTVRVENGVTYNYYSYNIPGKSGKFEDWGHGSFDGRIFSKIFKSGRYNFTVDKAAGMGNVFGDKMTNGPGIFRKRPADHNNNYPTDKSVSIKTMVGHMWYSKWNNNLRKNVVEYYYNELIPAGKIDAQVFWEILKLRSNYYNKVGPIWGKKTRAQ